MLSVIIPFWYFEKCSKFASSGLSLSPEASFNNDGGFDKDYKDFGKCHYKLQKYRAADM